MADENILQIGARVDLSALRSGMSEAAATVGAATNQMAVSVEKLRTETVAAFGSMAKSPAAVKEAFSFLDAAVNSGRTELGSYASILQQVRDEIANAAPAANAAATATRAAAIAQRDLSDAAGASVSPLRASYVAMEALRGGMMGSSRAAGYFATEMLGLGPILAAAFPIFGAVAMLQILGSLVTAHEQYAEALRKAAAEAINLQVKEADRALSLQLIGQRLEDQIAKIESRPTGNKLAEALLEAKQRADELAGSLTSDAEKSQELFDKLQHWYRQAIEVNKIIYDPTTSPSVAARELDSYQALLAELPQVRTAYENLQAARLASAKGGLDEEGQRKALEDLKSAFTDYSRALDAAVEAGQVWAADSHNGAEAMAQLRQQAISAASGVKDMAQEIKNLDASIRLAKLEQAEENFAPIKRQAEAVAQAERESGLARVAYQKALTTQLFEIGLITSQQQTTSLVDQENQRYEIERQALERRRSLLEQEHRVVGKNVQPELTEVGGKQEALESEHQAALGQIEFAGEQRRRQQADAAALATTAAQKTIADAQVALAQDTAHRLEATHKISIEQETAELQAAETKRFEAQKTALEAQLKVAQEYPGKNKAEIIRINGDIEAAEIEHQAKMQQIVAEGAAKQSAEMRRQLDEEVSAIQQSASKQLALAQQTDNSRLKTHQESLSRWEADEMAAINRWYEQQRTVLAKAMEQARQFYGQNSTEYQKMVDKMNQLDQQRQLQTQKVLETVEQKYEQVFNQVTGTLNRSVASWITGHMTFRQAALQVWDSLATDAINAILRMAEQYIMQHVLMAAANAVFGTQTTAQTTAAIGAQHAVESAANVARVTSDAGVAAAATLAWWSAINPPVAPAMAAAAFSETMAYAGAAAFEQGGIIPRTGLVLAHEGEGVVNRQWTHAIQNLVQNNQRGGGDVHMGGVTINNPKGSEMSAREIFDAIVREARRRNFSF